jgi:hypothetical protein
MAVQFKGGRSGTPLSCIFTWEVRSLRLAEGVDFKQWPNRLIACRFQVRYFLSLQPTLQRSRASWSGRYREGQAHPPRAAARASQPAFQEAKREVPTVRPHERQHIKFATIDAFAAALHAVTRSPGAAHGNAPAQVISLAYSLYPHTEQL